MAATTGPSSDPNPPHTKPSAPTGSPSISADQALTLLDIQRVTLEKLNVEYIGADTRSHFFSLLALTAQSPADQPFKLSLNGAVEKEFPYQLDFTGGKLSDMAKDKPWPISFTLTFLSSTLVVNGNVTASGSRGELTFGLGTENLLEFERLLQSRLPDVGPSGIAGIVTFAPNRAAIRQLTGAMGNTTLVGALDFDGTGPKPKLSGSLELPMLDLRPFLGEKPAKENSEPPRSFSEVYRSLSARHIRSEATEQRGRRPHPGCREMAEPAGRRKGRHPADQAERRDAAGPGESLDHGVALSGSAIADANASPPKFNLALGTRDSDLGGLAELLLGIRGVKGHLGQFDLKLSAQGDQGNKLVRSLDVRLDVNRGRFSYGNIEGGRPVEFGLDKLAIALPAGKALNGDMRGTLLGHPFAAQLHAGALEPTMLQGRTPLDFIPALGQRARARPRHARSTRGQSRTGYRFRILRSSRRRSGKLVRFQAWR